MDEIQRSPFPGMDPFLEDPAGWPDFHATFIVALRRHLSRKVSPHYHVFIQEQVYIEDAEDPEGAGRRIAPDAFVAVRAPGPEPRTGVVAAVTEPVIEEIWDEPAFRHRYLEVRDARSHEVVLVLEVLSPANKGASSSQRQAFLKKRTEVMASRTHWIEIDFLRGGERPPDLRRASDYYALLKRADHAAQREVWYWDLADPLPVIAVPLRPPHADATLELKAVFDDAYGDGFYADKIDYRGRIPPPRLRPATEGWASRLLK